MAAARANTLLAVAAGLTFTVAATLVGMEADTDPVGSDYDLANRTFVVPLALLVAWALRIRRGARRAGTTLTAGFGLMLAGVTLEFWGAWIADEHPSATARRLDEDSYFWGSDPGFAAFALGMLTVVVGFVLLARSRRGMVSGAVLVRTAVTGVPASLVTLLWTVSPAAAALGAIVFAVLLVLATEDPRTP